MGPHTSSGWIRWAGGCTWAEVVGSAQMIESKVGRRKGNETEEGTEVLVSFGPTKFSESASNWF